MLCGGQLPKSGAQKGFLLRLTMKLQRPKKSQKIAELLVRMQLNKSGTRKSMIYDHKINIVIPYVTMLQPNYVYLGWLDDAAQPVMLSITRFFLKLFHCFGRSSSSTPPHSKHVILTWFF